MLPVFPTELKDNQFPYLEGIQWEFKENNPMRQKLVETVCAMLNAQGGYIVIGVADTLAVRGISADRIDQLLLHTDEIHHHHIILREDDTPISLDSVKADTVTLAGKNLVRITVQPEPNMRYKMKTGEVLVRLSASNYRMNIQRVYHQIEVDGLLREMRKQTQTQVAAVLGAVKTHLADTESRLTAVARQRDFAEGGKLVLQSRVAGLEKENEGLRDLVRESILRAKLEAEQRLAAQDTWFGRLMGCF